MEYISAGDIEKYSYCPLSWWLSRKERHKESAGVKKHREISEKAKEYQKSASEKKKFENVVLYYSFAATVIALVGISFIYSSPVLSRVFIVISLLWLLVAIYILWRYEKYALIWNRKIMERMMVVFSLVATVFSIFSVTFFLPPAYMLGYALEIASLIWLIVATYFLNLTLKNELKYNEIKKELRLPDGEIVYVDDLEKSPILKSEKYGIWGRPDLLIKTKSGYVPVEIKTGRIPKGPLFSHIMQLTAYMLLVEENYETPPYGILKYGPVIYKIDYDEDLKKILLSKIEEMRTAIMTGEVHRNHHRSGKCMHCSRRDMCPERLS